MSAFVLALLFSSPAPAQTYRDTGSAFCICPDGRRKQVHAPETCYSYCGMGGDSGPSVDYGAIQRAQAEQAGREQREREAAAESARRARKAMEQREFEQKKAEALSSLKGVSTAEPALKGVSAAPNGLKGVGDGAGRGLKGLDSSSAKANGKRCQVTDACRDALAFQGEALENARASQVDLYSAAGTADLAHGLDKAQGALKDSGFAGRVAVYVWKTKDRLGLPRYEQDYKEVVDEASELLDEDTLESATGGAAGRVKDVRKKAETLDAFARYMRTLRACSNGKDADFNRCTDGASKEHSKTLEGLPLAEETIARVKAASEAFSRYSTGALKGAMGAAAAASKCSATCR